MSAERVDWHQVPHLIACLRSPFLRRFRIRLAAAILPASERMKLLCDVETKSVRMAFIGSAATSKECNKGSDDCSKLDIIFTLRGLQSKGLTQTEIGEVIGVKQSTVSDMSAGKYGVKRPSGQVVLGLTKLAKKYKVATEPGA